MTKNPAQFLPLSGDVVVILIALSGGPLHGYAIMQEAEESSGGAVRLQTGALYRTLKRLLDDGIITETSAAGDGASDRRRSYTITAFGERVLAADVERMAALVRAARAAQQGKRPRFA